MGIPTKIINVASPKWQPLKMEKILTDNDFENADVESPISIITNSKKDILYKYNTTGKFKVQCLNESIIGIQILSEGAVDGTIKISSNSGLNLEEYPNGAISFSLSGGTSEAPKSETIAVDMIIPGLYYIIEVTANTNNYSINVLR